jgi:hypothetical protein
LQLAAAENKQPPKTEAPHLEVVAVAAAAQVASS